GAVPDLSGDAHQYRASCEGNPSSCEALVERPHARPADSRQRDRLVERRPAQADLARDPWHARTRTTTRRRHFGLRRAGIGNDGHHLDPEYETRELTCPRPFTLS